ncbi:MAG: hypothetical protein ABSD29_05750 [Verrucomicrobiota bacterium]
MSPGHVFLLGDGTAFHHFRKNPFRPAKPARAFLLEFVKPASTRPIRPLLDTHNAGQASRLSTSIQATPTTPYPIQTADCPPRSPGRVDKVEAAVMKVLAVVFAVVCIGCVIGLQHIAHVRQIGVLRRQLREKDQELRAATQACHSLESYVAAKAAEEFRPADAHLVAAKGATR